MIESNSHSRDVPGGQSSDSHRIEDDANRPTTATQWYELYAGEFASEYERLSFEEIHKPLLDFLPATPCVVLDIGAGTGRDAARLRDLGHDVTAAEPSSAMREIAKEKHPNLGIHWIEDGLPKLNKVRSSGVRYDVILMSAVWMHVAESERKNAFRRIVSLLNAGGLLHITLRHGPHDKLDGFWDIPDEEVNSLARDHGLFQVNAVTGEDKLGRKGVHWSHLTFRSPGDGTGALPLLRGIVLNDSKSSTYKLALLRVLVQIAQSTAGMATRIGQDQVELPLGLFALFWIRMYRPLLDNNLPQSPMNLHGSHRLSFAKEEYDQLKSVLPLEFRVGMKFESETAKVLHKVLRRVCSTLIQMPMTYTTNPADDSPIYIPERAQRISYVGTNVLDRAYLYSFGTVRIPQDVWEAVHRYGTWIEPAIIAEWKTLMRDYAVTQEREHIDIELMDSALRWSDPSRMSPIPRLRAEKLIQNRVFNYCVWTGKKLSIERMDIDHCFPFSVWPCSDLWNLMPSSRSINQKQKRDKLPSKSRLIQARDRIQSWWANAYVAGEQQEIEKRFFDEANSSLSTYYDQERSLDDLFDSLVLQQTNLRINQQVPEWE